MEGEHTPTIIQLIQSMDLAVIQLKDSHMFFIFPTLCWSNMGIWQPAGLHIF